MHIYVDVVVISQRVKPKKRREKTEKNREKMKILQFKLNASFFDMCVRRLVVIMFACFTCKLLRSIRSNKNHFHFVVFSSTFRQTLLHLLRDVQKMRKKTHNCRCSCPMNRLIPSRNKYVYCLQHAYNTQRHIRMRFQITFFVCITPHSHKHIHSLFSHTVGISADNSLLQFYTQKLRMKMRFTWYVPIERNEEKNYVTLVTSE